MSDKDGTLPTSIAEKLDGCRIAVLIPCYNEEITVAKVVDDFKRELPMAEILVYDNCSTDQTAQIAREHGARVIYEKKQGKGFVIASMFRDIEADYYVMVDGDDTYDATSVHKLFEPVLDDRADMAVGLRFHEFTDSSFRRFHMFGNLLVRWIINLIFKSNLKDIMSGYRVFSRRVAKSVPVVSSGFEIETEMTLRMLYSNFVITEIPTPYKERPKGSHSKLNTFSDGARVIFQILHIFKSTKPFTFFGLISLFFFVLGALLGAVVIYEFVAYDYIYRVPTAILAASCVLLSFLTLAVGTILNTINYRFKELHDIILKRRD